ALGAVVASAGPDQVSDDAAAETVRLLHDDQATLRKLPELHRLRRRLSDLGLEPLLGELAGRNVDSDEAATAFRWSWLRSVLDEIELRSPESASFQPAEHDRIVAEYCEAARGGQALPAARIRRLSGERLIQALNAHPEQETLIRGEAKKKTRHK